LVKSAISGRFQWFFAVGVWTGLDPKGHDFPRGGYKSRSANGHWLILFRPRESISQHPESVFRATRHPLASSRPFSGRGDGSSVRQPKVVTSLFSIFKKIPLPSKFHPSIIKTAPRKINRTPALAAVMTNHLIYDCPNCAFSWLVFTDSLGTQEDPNEYHPKSEVPKKKQMIVLIFKL
jgi:hypothetical protein